MGSTKPVSLALTDEQVAKIERIGAAFGKNRSQMIQLIIDELPDPVESVLKLCRPEVLYGCEATKGQVCEIIADLSKKLREDMLAMTLAAPVTLASLMELCLAVETLIIRENNGT